MNELKKYFSLYWGCTWKMQTLFLLLIFVVLLANAMMLYIPELFQRPLAEDEWYAKSLLLQTRVHGSVVLFVFAAIGASLMFSSMSSPRRRLETLVMPVSAKVKYGVYFIIHIIMPVVAFFVSFFLVEWLRAAMMSLLGYPVLAHLIPASQVFGLMPGAEDGWSVLYFYSGLLFVQALFAMGSIFFPGKSLLKCMGIYGGLAFICIMTMLLSTFARYEDYGMRPRFDSAVMESIVVGFLIVFSLGVFVLSYFRFKGMEVKNRW
ncbi:MAG: hypothetical protein Q4F07_01435 [Bacteroidales bacterium]|nr:hypothetical protein [Bacteroidales bacterium]